MSGRITGLWFAACAILSVALAVGGSAAADSPRCFYRVYGPMTRPGTLVSKATFRCSAGYRGTRVRVAIQRRVSGHWMTVGQGEKKLDVAPGRNYRISTSVPCGASSGFTGVSVRTYFAFATRTGRLVLPSASEPAVCTLG